MARSRGERHHVMFPRRMHTVMPETKHVRELIIPRLETEAHIALHGLLAAVPVPDYHMARRVAREFRQSEDPLKSIDRLIFAYDQARHHPKARTIEREVGSIIIASLEMQKPLIKDGIIE